MILCGPAMSSASIPGLPHVDAMTPAVLVLTGPVTRDEVAGLCDEVRALLEATEAGAVVVDVAGIGPPGLGAVDLLARLELAARRAGAGSGCGTPRPPYTPSSASSDSASRWRGRPNSGNQRLVSRKKWNPVSRPSEISSTCTAHGA